MKPITRCVLAVCLLLSPDGLAQTPQPGVREIATIPGVNVDEAVRLPNRRVMLYTVGDEIKAYDLAAKRSTLVTGGFSGELNVSPVGDRIAFVRESGDGQTDAIVTVPIDSRTGTSTGPAHRVGTSDGASPSFSPDGRLITFVAQRTPSSWDLVVIALAGSAERTVATYEKPIRTLSWSADGRWIFVQHGRPRALTGLTSIERVPAAGGPSESVISYSPLTDSHGSVDGQIGLYRPDRAAQFEGRIAYVTASAASGEFQIPPGSRGFARSAQSLLIHSTRAGSTHLLNLADGALRGLGPRTWLSLRYVWSPDSRRLAVQEFAGRHHQLTVMDADGSKLRRYPVIVDPTGSRIHWSPDSQMLAYYAGSSTGATTVNVLDPATGNIRTVFSAADLTYADFMWRPDGKSIVLLTSRTASPREVYEVGLDDTVRKLRDVDNAFMYTSLISDRMLLRASDSNLTNSYALAPTSGGPAVKLPDGVGHRCRPTFLGDGKSVLFMLSNMSKDGVPLGTDTRQGIWKIELIGIAGDSSRIVDLPFEAPCQDGPPVDPAGRHVILVGRTPGDSASKIFLVPLNGDPPRVLTTFTGTIGCCGSGRLDLSPDGRTLVFNPWGTVTSTIYELDVSPILRSIAKR